MLRLTSGALSAAVLGTALFTTPCGADPKAAHALFETRHLDQIGKGSEVTYRFERKVSDVRLLGAGFTDEIRLGVTKINAKKEREVVFKVFTGASARDPSSWPDLTINPILIWYLDRSVGNLVTLAGGSQVYLKARFREALRDKARIEAIKFKYKGQDVDAFRVTVVPYGDDPNSLRMEGFENSRFTIVVSDQVPGYFLDLVADFDSRKAAAPRLEEHISLVGMGEVK